MQVQLPYQVLAQSFFLSAFEQRLQQNHTSLMPYDQKNSTYAAVLAACVGVTFFPSLLYRILGGGARFRRPTRDRTRTILPWMAQETQYWSFKYIFGTA